MPTAEKKTLEDIAHYYGMEKSVKIVGVRRPNVKGGAYYYGALSAKRVKSLGVDICLARYIPSCYFAFLLGMNFLYEAHAMPAFSGNISERMFRQFINSTRCKGIVAISEALKRDIIQKYNIDEESVHVLPDAADKPVAQGKMKLPGSNGKFQVGYIGHLYKGRGINLIVELARRCPWAVFHLIGGEDVDREHWEQKTGSIKNIVFHGYVQPSQLDQFRTACDAYLAPYSAHLEVAGQGGDTSRWMSPLKVFEYMASNRPMLVSKLPVLEEVLTHKVNAFLCDPDDVEDWQETLEQLRNNSDLGNKVASAAFSDFESKYTWRQRAKNINAIIARP